MRRVLFAYGLALMFAVMLGPPAAAAASALSLSAAPFSNAGMLEAAITASGTADPTMFGSDELDVFAAPNGSACAASAQSEEQNLGFPNPETEAYPGSAFVTGSFSQQITFDSGTSSGGTYVICVYLSEGSTYGTTDATAQSTVTLTPGAPAASTLSLQAVPKSDATGYSEATITATGNAYPSNLDQLDVFIAPSGTSCAPTAAGEDQQLAAEPGSAQYPIGNLSVQGSFSDSYGFDPNSTGDGTYGSHTICGYLTEGGAYGMPGTTDVIAQTNFSLTPPPQPTGRLRARISRHTIPRGGGMRITLTGSLTWTALPATVGVYLDDYPCDGPGDYARTARVSSTRTFRRSFRFRFPRNWYRGSYFVCAYLANGHRVYAHSRARLSYNGPPQPKSAPPPPLTQLQKVENAVLNAATEAFGGSPDDFHVLSRRRTGPNSWNCIVASYSRPWLGRLQATVTDIEGHYYVGPFESVP